MRGLADPAQRKRLAILALILLPIALHFGDATARLLVPEVELALDANPGHELTGRVAVEDSQPIAFADDGTGLRSGVVPPALGRPSPTTVRFRWDANARRASDATVDGEPLPDSRIVTARDVMPSPETFDFVVLRLPRTDGRRTPAIVGLSALLWLGLLAVLHPVLERRRTLGLGALSIFTYSAAWTKLVTRRDLLVALVVTCASIFSIVGVDAVPIYNVFRGACAGLDMYQYQVNYGSVWHFEFPTFAYNPSMLEFWTFFDRIWGAAFGHAPAIWGKPYLQLFFVKLVNGVLLALTVLSVLSFAQDEKLGAVRPRSAFHLAFFNPLAWYVALLFVQFDTVPLYFATLGLLLSHRFDRHGLVGPLLLGFGCSMKYQGIILLPTSLVAFLYAALATETETRPLRERLRTAALGLVALGAPLVLFRWLPSRPGAALQLLFRSMGQFIRAYFGFAYAGDTLFYFMYGSAIVLLLFWFFSLRLGSTSRDVIVGALLGTGALVAAVNAAHLYTPSTLLQLSAALTLTIVLEPDPIRRVAFSLGTALIVASCATQPYGDITRLLPGRPGSFAELVPTLQGADHEHFGSLPFTASIAGLIAYAALFWRGARAFLTSSAEAARG